MSTERPTIGTSSSFAPGWHEGVSMEAYLADGAVQASQLWTLFDNTPADLLQVISTPHDKGTNAQELGSLLHTLVFERDEFDERYVVLGQCEAIKGDGHRCSNQGSIYRDGQSFCGVKGHDPGRGAPTAPDIHTIAGPLREQALAMHAALEGHPAARALLWAAGPAEITGVWKDEETGLWCRIRPDRVILEPASSSALHHWSSVNLKSTAKRAGPGRFALEFNASGPRGGGYFRAALYRMGLRTLFDVEPQNFFFPVVESFPPYKVIVYRLHEDALDIGETEVRQALRALVDCISSGRWPGHGPEIHNLTLPDWRLRLAQDLELLEVA